MALNQKAACFTEQRLVQLKAQQAVFQALPVEP